MDAPKIDLTTFFLSISTAAFLSLGIAPPGLDAKPEVNLGLAKQNIDLLELMEEKTRGNRSVDETQLLEQLLYSVRMRFVELTEKGNKG